jgi:spermidine/putrescine-binding protein
MKRRGFVASTLAATVALALPLAAQAQEVKLRVANWLPPRPPYDDHVACLGR